MLVILSHREKKNTYENGEFVSWQNKLQTTAVK